MNKRVKFFRDGIMLTAATLVIRTVAMLFGAFITRTVGAEGVGLYTVVMTVYSFAVTFATSGISLTVTRLVAGAIGEGREDGVGGILRGAFIYSLGFGAVGTLVLFFGADFIGSYILSDIRTAVPLKVLAASLLPSALSSLLAGYFVGVKRVGANAAAQVFSQMVRIVGTALLVFYVSCEGTERSVTLLALGITITETLSFLFVFAEFVYDRLRHKKGAKKAKAELPPVISMALPLALSAYVRSVFLTIEHILIPKRLRDGGEDSSEAYSHYGTLHGMALPMILYPMTPLSSFSGLLVPEFAESSSRKDKRAMSRIGGEAMNKTLTYATLAAVFLAVFSEELGYIVYDSYDAGYYIAILAPVVPIMYLDHVTDSMLKGIGEQVFSMWVNITDSILSVVLVWFLIPRMGIMGYAVVIVLMEGYNFILSVIRLGKRIKFRINPVRSLVLPLVFALLSAHTAKSLFHYNGRVTTPFWLFMKMLFALCVFVFMMALCSVLSERMNKNGKKQRKSTKKA